VGLWACAWWFPAGACAKPQTHSPKFLEIRLFLSNGSARWWNGCCAVMNVPRGRCSGVSFAALAGASGCGMGLSRGVHSAYEAHPRYGLSLMGACTPSVSIAPVLIGCNATDWV